ncbi:MAG: hypothetical protein WA821_03920 [Anaerolineales bacterium]
MTWLDMAIKVLWSGISFLLIAGICFWLVSALLRRLRVRREREHAISIHHKANFRAFYYLAVEAPPQPALRFRLMAGNLPLVEVSRPAADVKVVAAPPAKAPKTTGKPAKTASPASSPLPHPAQQKIAEGGNKAMAKAGSLANMLGALAGLLPGGLGDGVRQQQEEIRQAQVQAASAAQAPQQAKQRVTVIQSESQKLGVKPPAAKQAAASPAASPSPSAVTVSPVVAQVEQVAGADAPQVNPVQHPFGEFYCVQTVELDPDQTLPLKLVISPAARQAPVGSFAYTLHLQAVPLEHFQEKIPVLSRRGAVHYAPVAAWRSFMPGFAGVLALLLGLLSWFYLLDLIW